MMAMTNILRGHLKWLATRTMILVAVLCCASCDSIYDDEGDCDPRYFVRFVYDMNMLYADAFAAQVGSVDLYVFDAETGEYVAHFAEKGTPLTTGSYRMSLDLKAGKYDFIAWCGLADNEEDFALRNVIAKPEDLQCAMARSYDEGVAYSSRNLHSLFHGSLTVELPDEEGDHIYTVKLTKDTNNINLSLNHAAGPLDPNRFEVTMTDENGLMAYDNSLMADEPIEYRPWSLRGGTLDMGEVSALAEDEESGSREAGFLVAEISTARLIANRNAQINIVDKEKGKTVFSIPLVKWALMLRSANHAKMGEQEYLDREDEYNLMVFLADDNKEGWMAMYIVINGWHIIDNGEVEL